MTEWIENPGMQPVEDGVLVDVKFLNGDEVETGEKADTLSWKKEHHITHWKLHKADNNIMQAYFEALSNQFKDNVEMFTKVTTGGLPEPTRPAPPMPSVKAAKVVSDGGSSSYYQLTVTNKAGESIACETGDILRALVGNDFDLANIVKACRRVYEASQGRGKAGVTIAYDCEKIKYFANEYAHWHKDGV